VPGALTGGNWNKCPASMYTPPPIGLLQSWTGYDTYLSRCHSLTSIVGSLDTFF
jgi:hypothetical protein